MTKDKKYNDWRDNINPNAITDQTYCNSKEAVISFADVREINSMDEMSFGIEELENIAAETEKRTERIFKNL